MLDMPFASSTGAQWPITNVGHAIQAEPLKHRRIDNQKVHDDDPVGKAAPANQNCCREQQAK